MLGTTAEHTVEDCNATVEEHYWHIELRRDVEEGRRNRILFEQKLQDPELIYALVGGEVIHERSCSTVLAASTMADQRLTDADAEEIHGGGAPSWPKLLKRQEALDRNLRRCRLCAPDLPEKVKSRNYSHRRSALGWPEPHGARSQPRLEPGACR